MATGLCLALFVVQKQECVSVAGMTPTNGAGLDMSLLPGPTKHCNTQWESQSQGFFHGMFQRWFNMSLPDWLSKTMHPGWICIIYIPHILHKSLNKSPRSIWSKMQLNVQYQLSLLGKKEVKI